MLTRCRKTVHNRFIYVNFKLFFVPCMIWWYILCLFLSIISAIFLFYSLFCTNNSFSSYTVLCLFYIFYVNFYHFVKISVSVPLFFSEFYSRQSLTFFVPYLSTSCLPLVSIFHFFPKLTRCHLLPFAFIASICFHSLSSHPFASIRFHCLHSLPFASICFHCLLVCTHFLFTRLILWKVHKILSFSHIYLI